MCEVRSQVSMNSEERLLADAGVGGPVEVGFDEELPACPLRRCPGFIQRRFALSLGLEGVHGLPDLPDNSWSTSSCTLSSDGGSLVRDPAASLHLRHRG